MPQYLGLPLADPVKEGSKPTLALEPPTAFVIVTSQETVIVFPFKASQFISNCLSLCVPSI
jgi:hypothetical protein